MTWRLPTKWLAENAGKTIWGMVVVAVLGAVWNYLKASEGGVAAYVVPTALIVNILLAVSYSWQTRRDADGQPAEASEGTLTIHHATWGPTKGEFDDVTDEVRRRAHPNFINIPIENAVLGDKFPGRGKLFKVTYSIVREKTILESPTPNRLILPEPEIPGGIGFQGATGPGAK